MSRAVGVALALLLSASAAVADNPGCALLRGLYSEQICVAKCISAWIVIPDEFYCDAACTAMPSDYNLVPTVPAFVRLTSPQRYLLDGCICVSQHQDEQSVDDNGNPITIVTNVNQKLICPAVVKGDPQFTGFMGQDFQVHGTSDTIYNVLSTPNFQFNALFRYLESGRGRKGTQAFAHPGNYFGDVGMQIKSNGTVYELMIQSGPVDAGLILSVNSQVLPISEHEYVVGAYTVSLPTKFEVLLESDEFNIRVQNSDMFLNQDVSISTGLMNKITQYKQAIKAGDGVLAERLKAELPHGILGQTWNTAIYNNRWKHIEGHLFDYAVADGLMGEEFKYNKF